MIGADAPPSGLTGGATVIPVPVDDVTGVPAKRKA